MPEAEKSNFRYWGINGCLGFGVFLLFIIFCVMLMVDVKSQWFACGECRKARYRRWIAGVCVVDKKVSNECSRWYARNVAEEHEHVWIGVPEVHYRDLFWIRSGRLSLSRGEHFWALGSDEHLQLLRLAEGVERERRLELVRELYRSTLEPDEQRAENLLRKIRSILVSRKTTLPRERSNEIPES